eukprot:243585-Amphidinium_carterae.1
MKVWRSTAFPKLEVYAAPAPVAVAMVCSNLHADIPRTFPPPEVCACGSTSDVIDLAEFSSLNFEQVQTPVAQPVPMASAIVQAPQPVPMASAIVQAPVAQPVPMASATVYEVHPLLIVRKMHFTSHSGSTLCYMSMVFTFSIWRQCPWHRPPFTRHCAHVVQLLALLGGGVLVQQMQLMLLLAYPCHEQCAAYTNLD